MAEHKDIKNYVCYGKGNGRDRVWLCPSLS